MVKYRCSDFSEEKCREFLESKRYDKDHSCYEGSFNSSIGGNFPWFCPRLFKYVTWKETSLKTIMQDVLKKG